MFFNTSAPPARPSRWRVAIGTNQRSTVHRGPPLKPAYPVGQLPFASRGSVLASMGVEGVLSTDCAVFLHAALPASTTVLGVHTQQKVLSEISEYMVVIIMFGCHDDIVLCFYKYARRPVLGPVSWGARCLHQHPVADAQGACDTLPPTHSHHAARSYRAAQGLIDEPFT